MIIKKIEERMNLSLGSYSKELSTVRTGRANPKMLDGVRVDVYGQKMPISQLATVSIPEPQMINVQVWDKSNVGAVDQAVVDFGKEIKQNLIIKSFIKYKVGEGIEVKKTDFNEEVKSLAGA